MGVQNLWVLLAPVGRQIEIESLAGQVLAVDASIWLTQFVKAMRDDDGNMIRNAHLMGTLHRVAKLLYYGIRPVFVFDGQTPEIKKRTTARRKKRQEQQSANLRHTAQRILLNRLKQVRQAVNQNGGAPASAVASGFTLPEPSTSVKEEEKIKMEVESEVGQLEEESIDETEAKKTKETRIKTIRDTVEEEEEQLTVDDIALDSSKLSKIDFHAVFSLPPHLQKDMIHKIQRDRRQDVRNQFIPLAGNPEKYSHTQITAFLQTSALNRQIEAAKKQKREEELNHQGGVGLGHRINSNGNRFYIYEKDTEQNEKEEKKCNDVMVEAERSTSFEDAHSNKKRGGVFDLVDKRPLSKLPTREAGFSSATDATAAWLTRHHIRAKQEPTLAIEKLRQARLKDVNISTKFGFLTDLKEMAQLQKFATSEPEDSPIVIDDDKFDNSNWEKVAAPLTEPHLLSSLNVEQKMPEQMFDTMATTNDNCTKGLLNANEENSNSDEEIEWEDVQKVPENSAIKDTSCLKQAFTEEKLDSSSSSTSAHEKQIQKLEEIGNDDSFFTLKSEMEDAKAHKDLDLLKTDALQSAMVTASNLTQWAAGAVRRALQAHSLQHIGLSTNASRDNSAADRQNVQFSLTTGSAKSSPKNMDKDYLSKSNTFDSSKSLEADMIEDINADLRNDDVSLPKAEDNYEQLQAELAVSTGDEGKTQEAESSCVRYLQYSQSNQSSQLYAAEEPEMDAVALQTEHLELKKLRNRQQRDMEGITDDMVAEVMALLRLFGVPFLVSPMEAEAQCAALEQLGLVDGVITDDSDIFPFGGKRVYKNIFHHQKFVEAFSAFDIEQELGFSREQIIAIAMLLGSDYTDGVRGIGIVNASEIAAAYPGIAGLRDFKEWVQNYNVAEEAQRVVSGCSKPKKKKLTKEKNELEHDSDDNDVELARVRFQQAHATARRKWELGDEFPSNQVLQAYMAPQVDRSEARFSWTAPDVAALRSFCANAFGWDKQKSDGVLKPLEEKARAAAADGGRHIQTRLDRFFTSYKDQVHYAQIKSKRLRSAVHQGTGSKKDKSKKQKVKKHVIRSGYCSKRQRKQKHY
ncbi:dna repair [Plasmopara halstedii]|uniref:Dna repair n=1 Tax=Plasmopara halstedii TaxID=4781 RepID=A0A0P1AUM4_PLAHL|nr:dna repair [Plasmopara halstedii]CEG45143.1 dna repair [Plasmopara halstedii]|eukprot:XP_024581512.1 dna repair [Plasmopara halstedii]